MTTYVTKTMDNFDAAGAVAGTDNMAIEQGDSITRVITLTSLWSQILSALGITAADVDYDNATSGLTATDVQAAIDEIVAGLGTASAQNYEAGTFTPSLTFATPGDLAVAASTAVGQYSKLGDRVWIDMAYAASTFTYTTASGNLKCNGLPFARDSAGGATLSCRLQKPTWTSGQVPTAYGPASQTYLQFGLQNSGSLETAVTTSNVASGSNPILQVAGTYTAA